MSVDREKCKCGQQECYYKNGILVKVYCGAVQLDTDKLEKCPKQ